MKILLTILTITLCFNTQIFSQTKKGKTKNQRKNTITETCKSITSPTIRGLNLSLSADELYNLYPQFKNDAVNAYYEAVAIRKAGGISMLDLGVVNYTHQITKEGIYIDNNPNFEGLNSIGVSLYDGKILDLLFRYEDYQPNNINEFIQQVSSTLKLPSSHWKKEENSAELNCAGFKVNLSFGIVGETSLLHLQNKLLYEEMHKIEKKKTEEAELKKKVFKP